MTIKCDRCKELYQHTPVVIKGVVENHFICPVCAYDLKKLLDAFVNRPPRKGSKRLIGHKSMYATDL